MFRLSQGRSRSGTVVTIDGQLFAEHVPLVEQFCIQALEGGQPVSLFLRDVSTIDKAGRDLLCRVLKRGIRLQACGVYMSHLVKTLGHAERLRR